jgi:hypothetical protein
MGSQVRRVTATAEEDIWDDTRLQCRLLIVLYRWQRMKLHVVWDLTRKAYLEMRAVHPINLEEGMRGTSKR